VKLPKLLEENKVEGDMLTPTPPTSARADAARIHGIGRFWHTSQAFHQRLYFDAQRKDRASTAETTIRSFNY